ncbi:MAG: flagellar biosynthesis anti-sigma factor FlgM [Gammaproteobacteria bacterium]|nr:flagellar biosynthesis anti-sigma factor FlgM [Gammaproteobacteria bacterium]
MYSIFATDMAVVASNLTRIADAVSEAPDIDTGKVASARAALNRGEYQVDAERIAEKLMQIDATLRSTPQRRHG